MRFTQEYPKKMEWWFYIGTLYIQYKYAYDNKIRSDKYFNGVNCDSVDKKIKYRIAKCWFSGKGGPNNIIRRVNIDHCYLVGVRI